MAMARIVTINNQKYELPEPNIRIPFTDDNGKFCEFDEYMFHNPWVHETLGFTTTLSVLKWWVTNRDRFIETVRESGNERNLRMLFERMEMYFDYLSPSNLSSGGLEELKARLSGNLREPSLRFVFNGTTPQGSFILLPNTEEPEAIKITLGAMFHFQVEIRVGRSSVSSATPNEAKWDSHYNYTFKMDPDEFNWFRTVKNENKVMFGLELEVCTKLTTTEIQKIVQEVEPKQEPFFIFKQDSSISGKYDKMLEIVTVPCSPRYLRKHWKIFFQKLERLCCGKGMSVSDVFDTSRNLTNGLHIHVSRDSFEDKPHYNKFLTAWNQWNKSVVNLFNAVSERPTDYTKNGYCRINRTYDGMVLSRRLKGIRCEERQSVAHDLTGKTIEVRVFQGIMDLGHIMKCISFTEAMFEFCQSIGYSNFDLKFVPSMAKFIRSERKYASLYEIFEKASAK